MHHISYIKKEKRYDFTIEFKSTEHRIRKVAQYKKDAIVFKMTKLSNTVKHGKYIPCPEKTQTVYSSIGKQRISHHNEHKTYIKSQG